MQFHLIICGLDSVEARRWINATLVNMVDEENPESLKPLIDGGTEGSVMECATCIYRIIDTISICLQVSAAKRASSSLQLLHATNAL